MLEEKKFYDQLNVDAIFSDETENFVNPNEPMINEPIEIKLRVGKDNVEKAYIVISGVSMEMTKFYCDENFDFYKIIFAETKNTISYCFSVVNNGIKYFYNKNGVYDFVDIYYNFKIIPGFKTPDWAKSSVMYQIYVDRFFNGDKANDVVTNEYKYLGKPVKKREWNEPVTSNDVWDFYGGDLQGVIYKLNYLADLGVECIYFNPIFVAPSNHKYDIQDYDYVDPHIGVIKIDGGEPLKFERFRNCYATMYVERTTNKENLEKSNELLALLIKIAHSKNIKVILDGVFNHCGAANKWLDAEGFYKMSGDDNGAYHSIDSKYHDYFKWHEYSWPENSSYDSWWGHKNHPKLNFEESEELEKYILEVGKKWVSPPYNADGWRLDVAADLGFSPEYNHKFWKKFRKVVKEANKDAIIIAEHYGDPSAWLEGDQWDTVMNYDAFMEPITWFLTGVDKHSENFRGDLLNNSVAFKNAMKYNMSKLSIQSLNTSMNQLSNHDHSRFLTRTNGSTGRLHSHGRELADTNIKISVMYIAVIMQMTWTGSPTLYYGDEAGVTGWTDPDNRRCYPWGMENYELLSFYKSAIKIHKENECLKFGSLNYIHDEYGILSYGRWKGDNKIVVVLNNNKEPRKLVLPVWKLGIKNNSNMEVLLKSKAGMYTSIRNIYNVRNGILEITIADVSAVILREVV